MPTIATATNNAFQCFEQGDLDRAAWWCHQVLQFNPNQASVLNLLGSVCYRNGQLMQAIGWYREAIDAQPTYAESYNNLGVALQDLGQWDTALAQFEAAIAVAPSDPKAYYNLGNWLEKDGQHSGAIAAYERALSLKPDYNAARNNLAYLQQSIGNTQQAAQLYRQTLAQDPNSTIAHMNLANLLQEQGNLEGAIVHYEQVRDLTPNHPDLAYNLAILHQHRGEFKLAIQQYYLALQRNPRHAASHYQLGILLRYDRPIEAVAHLQQAITYQPNNAAAYHQIGLLWRDRLELTAAIASFRMSLELDPDEAVVQVNLGETLLLMGDYPAGFAAYEWRWQSPVFLQRQLPRHPSRPRWDGKAAPDKTILLWAEQGIAEALQCLRYIPVVMGLAATVIVECDRQLVSLLQTLCPEVQVIAKGDDLPAFDDHAPFLSLPLVLGTTIDSIPSLIPVSLLVKPDDIKPDDGIYRIGIAWADRPIAGEVEADNPRNSLPLSLLLNELRGLEQIEIYNLQRFCTDAEKQLLAAHSVIDVTLAWGDLLDMSNTLLRLDSIVTVDSEIAHLSGLINPQKTKVMLPFLPNWCWGVSSQTTPWYEHLQIFRQSTPGNWTISDLAVELCRKVEL
jgi:tetratricopeptide (TPR) repeat protein